MINEKYNLTIKGSVVTSWTDGFEFRPISETHNEIMYATSDCLAQLYVGQPRQIPAKIGFIFSNTEGSIAVPTAKSTSWEDIVTMCNDNPNADIQIVDFSFSPSLTKDNTDGGDYNSNVSVFHGHTDAAIHGYVHNWVISDPGMKIYGAVLMSSDNEAFVLS